MVLLLPVDELNGIDTKQHAGSRGTLFLFRPKMGLLKGRKSFFLLRIDRPFFLNFKEKKYWVFSRLDFDFF